MNFLKTKMQLQFPALPLIYAWIQNRYDKCQKEEDYINFVHYCFDISEKTNNEIKKDAYLRTGYTVYSMLIRKSYESKII